MKVFQQGTRSVVLFALLLFSPILAEKGYGSGMCSTHDSATWSHAASIGTLKAAVVYACNQNASTKLLPSWAKSIWNDSNQLSIPRYYKDNSLGSYLINATVFDSAGNCFTSPTPALEPNLVLRGNPDDTMQYKFFREIMDKADNSINFRDFDTDQNGVVDALFFVVANDTGNSGIFPIIPPGLVIEPWPTYKTDDTTPSGDTIVVPPERLILARVDDQERAVAVCAHEWGHALGARDWYGTYGVSNWGLGAFSIMGTTAPGAPQKRAVPFDPYNRVTFGWVTPTTITTALNSDTIEDYLTIGKVYKLPYTSNQYFLVTNYRGAIFPNNPRAFWQDKYSGHGLIIWHIGGPKGVDVELAHGLWNMDEYCGTSGGANPTTGKDSLDCAKKVGSTRYGYPDSSVQSGTCFFNSLPTHNKTTFDETTNPSSHASLGTGPTMSQNISTHIAVRNISTATTPGSAAIADLLATNWFGAISQNTTWSGTLYITEDVTVNYGATLTASPGTTIKVNPGKKLIVKGTFHCVGGGNANDSIIITSASATPVKGDWGWVAVESLGRGKFEFTRFSYADTALLVRADTATVRVRNCTFNYFKGAAVRSNSAKTNLGGQVPEPLNPDCGKNNIFMNTAESGAKAVIKTASPSGTLLAEMCWWSQNPPTSNWFVGNVDYTNWLAGPATPDTCALGGEYLEGEDPNAKVNTAQSRPLVFELKQNYPNPFNPATTIQYALPQAAHVELTIYNTLGQVVRTFVEGHKEAGYYQVTWDGKDKAGLSVSSGVYLCQIKAGDFVETKKMQLVK